jgi:hypothetical protein
MENNMAKQFEVVSDKDDGVVFTADSVARQATLWRTTPLNAARRIARENGDEVMGETLFVRGHGTAK